VIFDLDGTLINTQSGIAAALAASLAETLGHPADLDRADFSLPLNEMIRGAVPSVPGRRRRQVAEAFRRHYDSAYWNVAEAYPGAETCLRHLSAAGVRTFVVTNKRTQVAKRLLEHFGLAAFLEDIVGQADRGPLVSKAELAKRCLTGAGLDPTRTVVVGDSEQDAAMADAWHLACILITFHLADLNQPSTDEARLKIESLTEVMEIVLPGVGGEDHES
jgi:phosphoglycolate phosphatase-like HAD superfamily hydrolase